MDNSTITALLDEAMEAATATIPPEVGGIIICGFVVLGLIWGAVTALAFMKGWAGR